MAADHPSHHASRAETPDWGYHQRDGKYAVAAIAICKTSCPGKQVGIPVGVGHVIVLLRFRFGRLDGVQTQFWRKMDI